LTGVFPSLVTNGQSGTKTTTIPQWTRNTKRRYRSLNSWLSAQRGVGCQLLRVDLTSLNNNSLKLTLAFKALRRKVEKTFHTKINYYKIETSEGNGVLHMVWAVNSDRAAWIPQKWLSDTWQEITGARIVYIKRIRSGGHHTQRVSRYLVTQYLAGTHHESSIVRVSYSWWRDNLPLSKGWSAMFRYCKNSFTKNYNSLSSPFRQALTMKNLISGWTSLLTTGWWKFDGGAFHLSGDCKSIYLNQAGAMTLIFPTWKQLLK